jgi:hypothetical protein
METPNNISTIDSKSLAAYVVLYRTLGMHKDLSVLCMQELCLRRNNGDNFEYEKFIDEEISKVPKPSDVSLNGIMSLIESSSAGKA